MKIKFTGFKHSNPEAVGYITVGKVYTPWLIEGSLAYVTGDNGGDLCLLPDEYEVVV